MQNMRTTRLTSALAMGAFGFLAACSPKTEQTTDTLATTPPATAATPTMDAPWTDANVVDVLLAEVDGVDPTDGRVRMRDIFNLRGTTDSLQPTGYLPSFVEHLVAKKLLEPKFLYARQTNQPPATNGQGKK